jgi:hypothetical protein
MSLSAQSIFMRVMNIQEIKDFVNKNKDNYSIQLKRHNKDLYAEIDGKYSYNNFGQKLYHFIRGDDIGKCEVCGNNCKFDGIHKGYRKRCSYDCMGNVKFKNSHELRNCVICNDEFEVYKKRIKTTCSDECLLKLNKTKDVNDKRQRTLKKTMLSKYGVDHNSKMSNFGKKCKHTKLKRYGDENFVNTDKAKKTKFKKYGDENYNNSKKYKKFVS